MRNSSYGQEKFRLKTVKRLKSFLWEGCQLMRIFRFLLVLLSFPAVLSAQTATAPNAHQIEVEAGVIIHVDDWGGEGPPLLFLPSWASTSHIYDDFAPKFKDVNRVLVMNLRGHGPSSKTEIGYEIPRLIEDMKVVLDALAIDSVNLVGLSRASSLTTHFAAQFPDRVRSLVYLSGPIDRAHARKFYEKQDNLISAYRSDALEQAIAQLCFIDREYERPEGSFDETANEYGAEWRSNDPSPPYQDVKAPALAMWHPVRADADQFRAACQRFDWIDSDVAEVMIKRFEEVSEPLFALTDHDMEIFENGIEDSHIVEIPGAIYHTFVSHPDTVEAEMKRFLRRINAK